MKNLWAKIELAMDAVCGGTGGASSVLVNKLLVRSGAGRIYPKRLKAGTDTFLDQRPAYSVVEDGTTRGDVSRPRIAPFVSQKQRRGNSWWNSFCPLCSMLLPLLAGAAERSVARVEHIHVSMSITVTNVSYAAAGGLAVSHKDNAYSFMATCVFGRVEWWIQTRFARNAVETYYCDGTNVYYTVEVIKIMPEMEAMKARYGRNLEVGKPRPGDPTYLEVIPGIHPVGDFGVNLPWLAFCSGRFLRMPSRVIPLPSAVVSHSPNAFGFGDHTRTFSDDLGLPEKVEWRASAKRLRRALRDNRLIRGPGDSTQLAMAIQPSLQMPENFLRGSYLVESQTNLHGWTVPLRFRYQANDLGKGEGPTVLASGLVTEIRECAAPLPILTSDAVFSVLDRRFRHPVRLVDSIHYYLTNGLLPPVSDPGLQSRYKDTLRSAPKDPARVTRYAHHVIYGLFALTLGMPVIAAILWRFRKHRQNNNK